MTLIRSTLGLLGRVRATLVAAAVAAALGVFSAPATSTDAADLQSLQDQIQKLQREVDSMKAQQQAAQTQPPAPAAPAPASGSSAPSPSFMAGPIKVTLGGYLELMVINRNRNESADWASNFNTGIPFPNSHNYYLSEFRLTERQSRMQALFQGPDSNTWATETYVESDFAVTEHFFRARDIVPGQQRNLTTNATGFGGSLILPVVPKLVDFQASVLAGRGVGRYGSAQLPDATINPGTLGVEPLRGLSALAGLIVRPASAWTFYGYVGEERVSKKDFYVTAGGKTYGYGYGNGLFDNSGCETEGVGGNPNTDINIALISFRYYPFQK
jgi:hypothetical protein